MAALNTNRIAEVAGVGVGTLYSYFPDKTAILVAAVRQMPADGETATAAAMSANPDLSPSRAMVRSLLRLHASDKQLRRAVMSVHIGEGRRDEHGQSTQARVARIIAQLASIGAPAPDPIRFFIVTRAVLGVARALIEEPEETLPPLDVPENEVMNLIRPYLASD